MILKGLEITSKGVTNMSIGPYGETGLSLLGTIVIMVNALQTGQQAGL